MIIPLALPKNFTWSVPPEWADQVKPGIRVEVVLGKNKKYAGLVKKVHHLPPQGFDPKPILNILDNEPIVYAHQLQFWEWMAGYYMCTEGDVMQAALPSHFKLSSETVLNYNEAYGDDFQELDEEEFLVAEALLIRKELRIAEVQQILDASHVYPVIKRLIDRQVCHVWESLKDTYKEKKENYVLLHPDYGEEARLEALLNNWSRAPKQMELLLAYLHLQKTMGEVSQADLLKKSDATAAQLKGLVEKNILRVEKRSVDRIRYLPKDVNIDFELSEAQQQALSAVKDSLEEKPVCLLHGVTGSGKTQLYIHLMEECIRKGQQVLYMLPEIALTAQIIRRLQKHFGGHIAIYHSRFNANERIEIWNKVKSGDIRIVLGARSAIFMPFRQLGLVICDEEHDTSFKQQEPAPRYHARDAAIYLSAMLKGKVLLGSATPSLETYHNAVQGKFGLVKLNQRYGDASLPEIALLDTRKMFSKETGKIVIAPELTEAIRTSVEAGKQVILFQNRRGYSPYQLCGTCGWIPQCKNCNVSLTYHKYSHKLHCHYCGTVYPPVHICEKCGNHQFVQRNFGTERIEEELLAQLPEAKIARMDMDSVKGKHAHDQLIQQFEQQKVNVLVGTQMVVKGLDFEHVDLVGILDADSILGFTDFRVNERAFQLMEQVSGRAGRKDHKGKVMIQVSNIAHPVLELVRKHDYEGYYQMDIRNRQEFFYPPFSRIITLTLKHRDKDVVKLAAFRFAEMLRPKTGNYMVGPAEPVVNRVRNMFIQEITCKLPRDTNFLRDIKAFILDRIALLHQDKQFRQVIITPDVDAL